MIFITSWDDGHPLDERLSDLLCKWNIKGTFYLPISNSEGREVLSRTSIKSIDKVQELGSHTLSHVYLNTLSIKTCVDQIKEGKLTLEEIVGHEIKGFCYPGGVFNSEIRKAVISSGFYHARTIRNLYLDEFSDRFSIPTTFQFYPHKKLTLIRNYLKGSYYFSRYKSIKAMASKGSWLKNAMDLIESRSDSEDIIHVWGHSWEINHMNLWQDLDIFLSFVASLKPQVFTVNEYVNFISEKRNN